MKEKNEVKRQDRGIIFIYLFKKNKTLEYYGYFWQSTNDTPKGIPSTQILRAYKYYWRERVSF